jgi:hypothetical protein
MSWWSHRGSEPSRGRETVLGALNIKEDKADERRICNPRAFAGLYLFKELRR